VNDGYIDAGKVISHAIDMGIDYEAYTASWKNRVEILVNSFETGCVLNLVAGNDVYSMNGCCLSLSEWVTEIYGIGLKLWR
jgi:hypothetical protein